MAKDRRFPLVTLLGFQIRFDLTWLILVALVVCAPLGASAQTNARLPKGYAFQRRSLERASRALSSPISKSSDQPIDCLNMIPDLSP